MSFQPSTSPKAKRYYVWGVITVLIGIAGFSSAAWIHPLLTSIAATNLGLIPAYVISTGLAVTILICLIAFSIKVWSVAAEVGERDKHFRVAAIYRLLSVTFLMLGTISLFATFAAGYSQISAQRNSDNPLNAPGVWKVRDDLLGYSGNISNGFLKRLQVELEKNPTAKILEIESDGGYMDVASAAATILSRSKVTIAVRSKCQSACAYMWATSLQQAIAPKAVLGFHKPYTLTSFGDVLYVINTGSIRDAFERMSFPSNFIDDAFKSSATKMALIPGYELISRGICKAYVGDKTYDYASFGQATHDFLNKLMGNKSEINNLLPSAAAFSKQASELLLSEQALPDVTITFPKIKSLVASGFLDGSTPENSKRSATLLSGLAVATSEDFTNGWKAGQIIRTTSKETMSAFSELAISHLNQIHAALTQLNDDEINYLLNWVASSAKQDSYEIQGYQSLGGCGLLADENWTYFLTLSHDETQLLKWNDLLYVADFLGRVGGSAPENHSNQKGSSVPQLQKMAKNAFKDMPKKTGWSALATCTNLSEYIHGDMQKDRDLSLGFLGNLTDTTVKPLERCETMMAPGGNFESLCHSSYSSN